MTTKLVEIDDKNVSLTCAVCTQLVWMSHLEFIAAFNLEQEDEDTTALFILCPDCATLSPEELARKRLDLEQQI